MLERLGLKQLTNVPQKDITGVYIGDLLSLVMAKAKRGNIWLTVQTHLNVVAVASLLELACVIFVEGQEVEPEVIQKAEQEGVLLYSSPLPAYELALRIHDLW